MRIERIELRLVHLPLVRFFETSFGRVRGREFVLVTLDEGGATGVGECVADENPYYSYETTATAWHVIRDFIGPAVLGRGFAHPREVFGALKQIRGHHMAKAAVEMAAWDLFATQSGRPLWEMLGGDPGTARAGIQAGVSVGIQDTIADLIERVKIELAAGYRRVKIKVKPGWDLAPVEAVRDACGRVPLMVDANAAYTLADTEHLTAFDAYDLMMIEQPLDYDDIRDHACLQRKLRTPICLDESIRSVPAGEAAMESGACRIINVKPGRMGGHAESIRLHDAAARRGVPVWHGGMLESGIGRAHNIHLSTLSNFTLPGDVAASRRYYAPDLIEPEIDVRADGTIEVPRGPGIGVNLVHARIAAATRQTLELTRP